MIQTSTENSPSSIERSLKQLKERRRALLWEKLRRKASTSLHEFVAQAWSVLKPNRPFADNWHIGAICAHLEAVSRGEIQRLVINVPPRNLKSTVVSVCWPAWTWVHNPEHQWLCGSYALKLAIRDSLAMRRLIQSSWYQERWGRGYNLVDSSDWGDPEGYELTDDQNQKMRFENDRTGCRIAFGFDAGVMGEGSDTLLIDDPMDQHMAHSDIEIEKNVETFREGVSTRLNDPQKSPIVLVMQRLQVSDLSAHMIAQGAELLLLPMHYDPKRSRVTVIGFKDPRKEAGELLHPARFPAPVVAAWEAELQDAASGQLEQEPIPPGGRIIDPAWFRFYDELPAQLDQQIQSWDLAFEGKVTSNYVAGQHWAKRGANCYLIPNEVYKQIDFVETLEEFRAFCKAHVVPEKIVEKAANASALISTLKDEIPGIVPIPRGSGGAEAVAKAVAPYIKAGNVWLPNPYTLLADKDGRVPKGAPVRADLAWVLRLMRNAGTFPKASVPAGSHGDDVVAMVQAIQHMMHRPPRARII
jgi:phage terminase large subunit-like protein